MAAPMRTGGRLGTAAAVVAGLGALTFGYASVVERNAFTLRRVTAPVLPPDAEPITVLHLSDLHMAPWQRRKQAWLRSLADLRPDVVINTGDNLGHEQGIDGIRAALSVFAGVPGAFVHGSNDYYGPTAKNPFKYFTQTSSKHVSPTTLDTGALERFFMDELGWIDLNNAVGEISVGRTRLDLFGVDDPHKHFDRLDTLTALIDERLDAETLETDDPSLAHTVTVGVMHAPYRRVLDAFVTQGAQFIFAGHTHGGQVCVPGYGALVTNCDIPRKQVKGLSVWRHALRSAYLNVSAGVGTSIYAPVRFACRPEASLVTLLPRRTVV